MHIEVLTVNLLHCIVGDCNLVIKFDIQDSKDVGISEIEISVIHYLSQKFHSALLPLNSLTPPFFLNSLILLIPAFSSCKIRNRYCLF